MLFWKPYLVNNKVREDTINRTLLVRVTPNLVNNERLKSVLLEVHCWPRFPFTNPNQRQSRLKIHSIPSVR